MEYQAIVDKAMDLGQNDVAQAALAAAAQEGAAVAIARGLMILSMIGSAFGEALAVKAAFNAIGRNPKLEETLFSKVIISVALVESTAIYAFVAFFLMGA